MASRVRRTATESSAATDATDSVLDEDSALPGPQYVVGTGMTVDSSVMVDNSVMVKTGAVDDSVMVPAGHTQSGASSVHRMRTQVDESVVMGRASTLKGTAPGGGWSQNMPPRMSVESSASRASSAKTCLDKTVEQVDGPVQFIEINDEGKCRVKREACEILKMCEGSISVVSVAGLYRTGKSFLLNRLLGLQDGFDIGRSINPCTKGLWIWGRPVELAPDYHCILVDTEGLGSAQRSASHDLQILSLTVLLSSVFIYNSIGAIDEQAIDELHLVLQLASHVHAGSSATSGDKKGSKGKKEATAELAPYLPSFFWVLRDFHLNLEDKQGRPVTERGYLESALEPPSNSRPNDDKNRIRKVIRELFQERDCATLPRPVADEEDLRRVKDSGRTKGGREGYEICWMQLASAPPPAAFCDTLLRSLVNPSPAGSLGCRHLSNSEPQPAFLKSNL
ncbi:unnamed protein product [Prorocentrum cordatum]|uniref:GB1/RHD3-type G domain-containing protein n=1 Tax=Prorocentrum cordatum TaxID=2364126 RepID=A0ABN9TJ94_9DINO|nr:unnamed protein product [Polarella glacialis]